MRIFEAHPEDVKAVQACDLSQDQLEVLAERGSLAAQAVLRGRGVTSATSTFATAARRAWYLELLARVGAGA